MGQKNIIWESDFINTLWIFQHECVLYYFQLSRTKKDTRRFVFSSLFNQRGTAYIEANVVYRINTVRICFEKRFQKGREMFSGKWLMLY